MVIMWRYKINADWERRKEYLISLFQDVPSLSPVPEEEESFNSSRSRILCSPTFHPREPSRLVSPLPPLIIETEPNRHDEPEEFYIKLEQKVLRIYRKLFIEGNSDISSYGASDVEEDVETIQMDYISGVSTSFEKQNSSPVIDNDFKNNLNRSHDLDQTIEMNSNGRPSLKRTVTPNNDDSEASKSKRSKSMISRSSTEASPKSTSDDDERVSKSLSSNPTDATEDHETATRESPLSNYSMDLTIVTFRADVHRDATDYEFVRPPSAVNECDEHLERAVGDLEDNNGSAILENNAVSDNSRHNTSDQIELIDEIEVIRAEPIRPSVGSLHNQDTASSDDNHLMNQEPRQLEEHIESPSHEREPESMEFDIDFDLLHRRSTPVENNCSSEEAMAKRFRRNSTSSSSDISSICNADAGVQTSIDHESVNREVLRDIFVGTPKVFKLCSCANHTCNRLLI